AVSGTADWTTRSLSFVSGPTAVSANFKIEVYNGNGTAWIDNIRVNDLFNGQVPQFVPATVAVEGSTVTALGTVSGINIFARFSGGPDAIRSDLAVADTTGQDRAVEVSFRLPIDATDGTWSWSNSFVDEPTISPTSRYEVLSSARPYRSIYPFAAIQRQSAY